MVMDSLAFALDAGNTRSYPGTGTTWYDLTSNRYAGTMTAGLTYSSNNGGYINFPGGHYCRFTGLANTAMDTPNAFNGLTVTLWYYPTSANANQYVLTSAGGSGRQGFDILLQNSGNSDFIRVTSPSATWVNQNSVETLNVWQQIVAAWDKSSLITYVNGAQTNILTTTTTGYSATYAELCLGSPPGALGSYTYIGRIAAAYVHSRALNANEVLQNYNALRSRFGL
jgi:hypothetical protein